MKPLHALLLLFTLLLTVSAEASEHWLLRGRIVPMNLEQENGHYEVGLYSVIEEGGLPKGYPVVQGILPSGTRRFRLKVSRRLRAPLYLFAEFIEAGTGRRSWVIPTANPWTPSTPQPAELYLRVAAKGRGDAGTPTRAPSQGPSITGKIQTLFAPPRLPYRWD